MRLTIIVIIDAHHRRACDFGVQWWPFEVEDFDCSVRRSRATPFEVEGFECSGGRSRAAPCEVEDYECSESRVMATGRPAPPPAPAASGFKQPLSAILSRFNRAYAWRRTSHIRDLSAEQLYQMQIKCNPNQSAIKLKSNAIAIIKYKSNVPCLSNTKFNQMPASSNTHQMYSKSNTIQINIKCEWDYQIQIKCALVIKYKSNAHNIKCTSNILQIKWQSNTTSTIKCNSNTDQISIKWG